jgi:ribonuclease T2
MNRVFLLALLSLAFARSAEAKHHPKTKPSPAFAAHVHDAHAHLNGSACSPSRGKPGDFDYYVFTLSWSPEYCADHASDATQCGVGTHFSFVAHGLWPQYKQARNGAQWPQCCAAADPVPDDVAKAALAISPSRKLIQHEWEKHGTCSGLDVSTYFSEAAKVYQSLHIPEAYKAPQTAFQTTLDATRDSLMEANPGLADNMFAVGCKGQTLAEVTFCFDTDFKPRACGVGIGDACPASFKVLRVRHDE